MNRRSEHMTHHDVRHATIMVHLAGSGKRPRCVTHTDEKRPVASRADEKAPCCVMHRKTHARREHLPHTGRITSVVRYASEHADA